MTKKINPSEDAMATRMKRELMPEPDAYEAVNPTNSSIYDAFVHVMEYISYLLPMSVVFTLKYIIGSIIVVFGGNE